MHRLLLIEDHLVVSQVIAELFKRPAYSLKIVRTLVDAYTCLAKEKFDLVLIDLGLPDGDGTEIVRYLHQYQNQVPVIIISHRGLAQDRIIGLRTGADDYLPKPFAAEELELRVTNLLKKTKQIHEAHMQVGNLAIVPETGQVVYGQRKISLRKRECDILTFLAKNKNNVVSRERLIEHVWSHRDLPSYKSVDVYVRRLRSLLGNKGRLLQTVRGYGYVLRDK